MRPPLNLLIVSGCLETKRALMRIIRGLPVNTYTSSTIIQAWEVLHSRFVDLILCDETLPDGAYPEFLSAVSAEHRITRFVVLLASDEWEDYMQALKFGVGDALRASYQPTDLELILIRASRESSQQEELRISANA